MDQKTLIIVIVASSVAGLIVGFIVLRLIIHSCRRNRSAPIPPPQPLRHHALAAASRPNTGVYSSTDLLHPAAPFGRVSRTSSIEGTFESSGSSTTLPTPMDPGISMQPSFSFVSPSSASLDLSEVDEVSPSSSGFTHESNNTRPKPRSRQRASMSSSSHYSSRPASLASIGSRSTLRGVPHGPYSSIQVVLPAPLAGASLVANNRFSMVDSWAPTPSRDDTAPPDSQSSSPQRHPDRRSTSQPRAPPRRSSSSSMSPTSPTPSPLSMSHVPNYQAPPPVPRIPSMYNNYPTPGSSIAALDTRGRPGVAL